MGPGPGFVLHPRPWALAQVLFTPGLHRYFDNSGKSRLFNPLLLSICEWVLSIIGGFKLSTSSPGSVFNSIRTCVLCDVSVLSVHRQVFEQSGQVPSRRHGGLSVVFVIGELTKKSCFLFGVVFAIPCYKSKANVISSKITDKQCGTDYGSLERNVFR